MRTLLLIVILCAAVLAQTAPAPQPQFLIRLQPVRADLTLQNITEKELPILQQHGAYLQSLLEKGVLITAGQAFDPKGLYGIVVVTAPTAEAATAIMNGDPAIQNKVFRGEVIPYRTVFQKGLSK